MKIEKNIDTLKKSQLQYIEHRHQVLQLKDNYRKRLPPRFNTLMSVIFHNVSRRMS